MEKCWVGANPASFGGAGPQLGACIPDQVILAGQGCLKPLARADPPARFSEAKLSGLVVLGQSKQH